MDDFDSCPFDSTGNYIFNKDMFINHVKYTDIREDYIFLTDMAF